MISNMNQTNQALHPLLAEIIKHLPCTIVKTGKAIAPLLKGFRGKQGQAMAAVYPASVTDLYQLIVLCQKLEVGYVLQGGNTALKGQGTPNTWDKPVILIKTTSLNHIQLLDFPDTDEYKILLVEPGVTLKQANELLDRHGYNLPHKTGSYDLGNTFGASCANACGGIEVDNRDGRASKTQSGNMGVVAVSAKGVLYNGFIHPDKASSGLELLKRIEQHNLTSQDILLPVCDEIDEFLKKLFVSKSYPIHNHRGDILFAGDGGEGSQAILYQMYLVRKKPEKISTFFLLLSPGMKASLYQDVVLFDGPEKTDSLPIVCESMNQPLLNQMVNHGFGFLTAFILAFDLAWIQKHIDKLMVFRNALIRFVPKGYLVLEAWLGKCLAYFGVPKLVRKGAYDEMVIISIANRSGEHQNIQHFESKLKPFLEKNRSHVQWIKVKPNGFKEKLLLKTRTNAALATLDIALINQSVLLPFDDAIMPGSMTQQYCQLLSQRLKQTFQANILGPYLYGHDLKQISHNDWIILGSYTKEQISAMHAVQFETIQEVGGLAHAEHGIGDYADTDLSRPELVKLVAHRFLNDIQGIANPGGASERAFKQALQDSNLVQDAIAFAKSALNREQTRQTLLNWSGPLDISAALTELENLLAKSTQNVNFQV